MNLYMLQSEGETRYVLANSMADAILEAQRYVEHESGHPCDDEPEQVTLLADADEIIVPLQLVQYIRPMKRTVEQAVREGLLPTQPAKSIAATIRESITAT